MANSKQARKRAEQSVRRNALRAAQRSTFRTAIKNVRKAIAAGKKEAAAEVLRSATAVLDRLADKRIYHKNKAARHKSRLNAAVKAIPA